MKKKLVKKLIFMLLFITLNISISGANSLIKSIDKAKLVTQYGRKAKVDEMESVKFGMYPQDSESKILINDIEWLVLKRDEKNRKALLLSKYILDCRQFNSEYGYITWKDCSLRKWLNETFYNIAFSKEEKSRVLLSDIVTKRNSNVETKDYVFLLDTIDIEKYFKQYDLASDNPRLATYATYYAKNVDSNGERLWVRSTDRWSKGNSYFYLRDIGVDATNIAAVGSGGNIYGSGYYDSTRIVNVNASDGGVRPAIWISY